MKLNVGCGNLSEQGNVYVETLGWISLDIERRTGANVIADAFQMPFKDCTFEEIHSIHVLEHLSRDKWPLMLAEIFRVLQEGGNFYVEVPDFMEQCKIYLHRLEGTSDRERRHLIRTAIWGKTEQPGMGHQFGFDKDLLRNALVTMGFQAVKVIADSKELKSRHCKDGPVIAISCTKTNFRSKVDISNLSFDELRELVIK